MDKPPVLYHASPNRTLSLLEPRAKTTRSSEEGAVIFASADRIGVTKFLVPGDDSWTRLGTLNGIHYIIIFGKERYTSADRGGAVYHLDPKDFELSQAYGPNKTEWTSSKPVRPLKKEVVSSGMHEMLSSGVQVYFVDATEWEQLVTLDDDQYYRVIRSLTSENMKRGVNTIPSL